MQNHCDETEDIGIIKETSVSLEDVQHAQFEDADAYEVKHE